MTLITTTPTLDDATLRRLHTALDEVLATHQAELHASDDPEADAHRAACEAVHDALERMADGTYGRCTLCSAPLAVERLEIIPQAELCMPCNDRRNRLYG